MEWGVFVNWLRRGLLTVTLVVVLLVASLTGWLGAGTQDVVSRSLTTFGSFLTAHATALDQIWKLLGGVVTLISGSWLIYKMWYYADHNMPIRIAQFLKKHRLRFSEIRSALLNVIEGRRPSTPQNMPICLVGPLNVALRQVGLGKMDGALENLERSIISFENQRMVRQREAELFNAQLAGSYLLKGVILSARSSRANAETRRHDALEAEKHLDLALKTQPNDTEALFYRAINSSYLGNVPSALDDYNRVIGHLRTKSDDRVTSELLARSYFGAAQLWWEVNRKGKARDRARDAIDALPASLSESEEAGEMHKFLGEVREVLRPGPLAIRSTSTAIRILEPITSERARRLTMEAKQTLERLRLVQANTSITQIDEGAEESDSTDDDLNPPHQSAHPPQ